MHCNRNYTDPELVLCTEYHEKYIFFLTPPETSCVFWGLEEQFQKAELSKKQLYTYFAYRASRAEGYKVSTETDL